MTAEPTTSEAKGQHEWRHSQNVPQIRHHWPNSAHWWLAEKLIELRPSLAGAGLRKAIAFDIHIVSEQFRKNLFTSFFFTCLRSCNCLPRSSAIPWIRAALSMKQDARMRKASRFTCRRALLRVRVFQQQSIWTAVGLAGGWSS